MGMGWCVEFMSHDRSSSGGSGHPESLGRGERRREGARRDRDDVVVTIGSR